jgi:hypothetical protein
LALSTSAAATGPTDRAVIRGDDGQVHAFAPFPSRDLKDRVRGCQGMNPDWRPRGSNCHGIFPEQCGADLARAHLGKTLTPEMRNLIASYSPNGDVRFIRPGDAVIQDLRPGRLNIGLGAQDQIEDIDCY